MRGETLERDSSKENLRNGVHYGANNRKRERQIPDGRYRSDYSASLRPAGRPGAEWTEIRLRTWAVRRGYGDHRRPYRAVVQLPPQLGEGEADHEAGRPGHGRSCPCVARRVC